MSVVGTHLSFGSHFDVSSAIEITDRHFGTVATEGFGWAAAPREPNHDAGEVLENTNLGEFQIGSRLDFAIDIIGAKSIRYPGGTESWSRFSWRPSEQVKDASGLTQIEKLHVVIDYCAVKGLGLDFTFPVRGFDADSPEEEDLLRSFIRYELLDYADTRGVKVNSIKIGNEYNVGSEGGNQLAAEAYAHTANRIIYVIGSEVDQYRNDSERSVDFFEPDILIESGVLWRYGAADIGIDTDGDGRPDGNGVQDTFDIFSGIDEVSSGFVDGIDLHNLTLDLSLNEFMGVEPIGSNQTWDTQAELLAYMKARWEYYERVDPKFGELEYHSLAWSHPRRSSDPNSTVDSPIMSILQLHSLAVAGIESASSWLATGFSPNALVQPSLQGQAPDAGEVSAAGQAVGHMSRLLPGHRPISLEMSESSTGIEVVGFFEEQSVVVYLMNPRSEDINLDFNLHDVLASLSGGSGLQIELVDFSSPTEWRPSTFYLQSGVSREAEQMAVTVPAHSGLGIWLTTRPVSPFQGTTLAVEASVSDVSKLIMFDSYSELTIDGRNYRFTELDHVRFLDTTVSTEDLSDNIDVDDMRSRIGEQLSGSEANDFLSGTDFADILDGRTGNDTMEGGLGNDIYWVESPLDQVNEELGYRAGGGIDTIWSSVSYTKPQNVEILRLLSNGRTLDIDATGNDAPGTLVGNEGANVLRGLGGNDQLNGNQGDDTLIGGVGQDVLVGGSGADVFLFSSISESRAGISERDVLNGVEIGVDVIELSNIDANSLTFGVDDSFVFIGFSNFQADHINSAGQLRLQSLGGPNGVLVEADHNGDGIADFQILVLGQTVLSAEDFAL